MVRIDQPALDLAPRELPGASLLIGGQEDRLALDGAPLKGQAQRLFDGEEDLGREGPDGGPASRPARG
jgi:hypothetical protein